MSKNVTAPDEEKLKNLLNSLSAAERDAMYRILWLEYVKADVASRAEDIEEELDEEDCEVVANWFVYECDYDCNQSYWDNIDNLIDRLIKDR